MMLINSRALKSIVRKAAQDTLRPAGFGELRKGTYGHIFHRVRNERFHGVYVQRAKSGRKYTINLAYHFPIVPACLTYESKPLSEFVMLDFTFHQRLGFRSSSEIRLRDRWWSLEVSDEECEQSLNSAFRESLQVLDDTDIAWPDETRFIEWVTPEYISNLDLDFRERLRNWDAELNALALLLATIAMNNGNPALAREYLDAYSESWDLADCEADAFQQLLAQSS